MKNKLKEIVVAVILYFVWTILSRYVGFESVAILALSCIYSIQK